jgi:hypothetical protein
MVFGALGSVLVCALARADVAPGPGYVEHCTLARTCPAGKECVLCPADYRDKAQSTSVCNANLGSQGYVKQCQSWGASVWNEIWCRAASDSGATSVTIVPLDASVGTQVPVVHCVDRTSAGCSCSAPGRTRAGDHTIGLILSACGLLLLRRRLSNR